MTLPKLREDIKILGGYHSPQLDVEVRLNTNEAPAPPPNEFSDALCEAQRKLEWHRYPDRSATLLRKAIGNLHQCSPDQVFCANGSNEVLQTLLLAYAGHGRKVLTFEPTYAMHSHIALVVGATVIQGHRTTDEFVVDVDHAIELINKHRPAVTFLCSPNNPTGTAESETTIRSVLEAVESTGGLLVVDEAYGQFASWSALQLVDDNKPLVVTRTFSKTWAMAGARLGYCVGPTKLTEEVSQVVLPYHLDAAKQAAGVAALGFIGEMESRVAQIVEERGRLSSGLTQMGATVWPSEANFVLFRPPPLSNVEPGQDGKALWEALVRRSVLVRDTSSWDHLPGCLRVTVGSVADNSRFLGAMEDCLTELGAPATSSAANQDAEAHQ